MYSSNRFVGRNLVKFIPIVGWVASASVAAIITEIIGWTAAIDFAKSYRAEYKRKISVQEAADAYAEVEYTKKANNNENIDAEDFSK